MPIVSRFDTSPLLGGLAAFQVGAAQAAKERDALARQQEQRILDEQFRRAQFGEQQRQSDFGNQLSLSQFDQSVVNDTARNQLAQQQLQQRGAQFGAQFGLNQQAQADSRQSKQDNIFAQLANTRLRGEQELASQNARNEADAEEQQRAFENEQEMAFIKDGLKNGTLKFSRSQIEDRRKLMEAKGKIDNDPNLSPEQKAQAKQFIDSKIANIKPQPTPADEIPPTISEQLESRIGQFTDPNTGQVRSGYIDKDGDPQFIEDPAAERAAIAAAKAEADAKKEEEKAAKSDKAKEEKRFKQEQAALKRKFDAAIEALGDKPTPPAPDAQIKGAEKDKLLLEYLKAIDVYNRQWAALQVGYNNANELASDINLENLDRIDGVEPAEAPPDSLPPVDDLAPPVDPDQAPAASPQDPVDIAEPAELVALILQGILKEGDWIQGASGLHQLTQADIAAATQVGA